MSQDPKTSHSGGFDLASATSLSSSALRQLLSTDITGALSAGPAPAPCTFLLYAGDAGAGTPGNLGLAQYSYHMVMTSFRAVLRRFGVVRVITDPAREVDEIYLECRARGETCLFLSFSPPHAMTLGLRCPTVPIVAWEFGTIPDQVWDDDPRNDWRYDLRAAGKIILLSHFAAKAVREAMGKAFPVIALPPPVYDRVPKAPPARAFDKIASLAIEGFVWDSRINPYDLGAPLPTPPGQHDKQGLVSQRNREESAPAAESVAAQAEDPVIAAAQPKTLRQCVGPTLRFALAWYREAVRDLLPPPIARLIGRTGGAMRRTIDWLRGSGFATERPTFGRRMQISKHYALRWYREVFKDALPGRIEQPVSRLIEKLDRATCRQQRRDAAGSGQSSSILPDSSVSRGQALIDYPMLEGAVPLPEIAAKCFYPDDDLIHEELPARLATTQIDGFVLTSVLAPKDGRKNWQDLLMAFCTVFKETPYATLVLKMIGRDTIYWWHEFHDIISRLPAFKCRVVVLHGYLDKAQYNQLIEASHFIANTSLAEGLCLPLVEFMSAGRPAIAPIHTAMSDYIAPDNAVIVASGEEYCSWPHDPRNQLETSRHRIEWASVCTALQEAHRLVVEDRAAYDAMASRARQTMRAFCSDAAVAPRLASFLGLGDDAVRTAGFAPVSEDAASC